MRFHAILLMTAAAVAAWGQADAPERLVNAAQERALAQQVSRLGTDERVRFFEALAAHQPEEKRYQNMLALAHIQKMRETQDFSHLDRAAAIAGEVLSQDPANYEAQRVRSQIHLERHEFRKAAENSRRLIEREPQDAYNYGTLGDALIELGEYEPAAGAYQQMVNLSPDLSSYNRAAYYRFLFGDAKGAIEVMKRAVQSGNPALAENTAWCLSQLGDLHFSQGQTDLAEQAYQAAWRVFSNAHQALAGLGRVEAARGRIAQAIDYTKRAMGLVPLPDYAALLADYYEAAGRKREAGEQWQLVEFIDRLAEANKEVYNRNLALIYANHDLRLGRALQLAERELEARGDIYTWDAVAWASFKNGKRAEAQEAIRKALQLGTPDPLLHYHAGMIAKAAGQPEEARKHLARALELNPAFDVRQARLARQALGELSREGAAGGAR